MVEIPFFFCIQMGGGLLFAGDRLSVDGVEIFLTFFMEISIIVLESIIGLIINNK